MKLKFKVAFPKEKKINLPLLKEDLSKGGFVKLVPVNKYMLYTAVQPPLSTLVVYTRTPILIIQIPLSSTIWCISEVNIGTLLKKQSR